MNREEIVVEAQKRQLKMFKFFNDVCEKNDIQYFCAFGTVLGAARHKGFIPWDDDIDVGMLRADFEKLCSLPCDVWGDEYILVSPDSEDVRHDKLFGRVYLKNSHIQSYHDVYGWSYWDRREAWSTSLMLDIFVFDYVPEKENDRDKIYNIIFHKYRNLYIISKIKPITTKTDLLSNLRIIKKQIHGRILRITYKKPWDHYYNLYLKLVQKVGGSHLIGCYATTGFYGSAFNKNQNIWFYNYDDIFPLSTLEFEGMLVPVPREWEKLLHLCYDGKDGDYMTLPPIDQRYHIDFVYLDFGDGTKIIVDPIKGSLGEFEEVYE